ncbi:MAG: hypothetical protein ACD_58C00167G0008 [uncultured bacterium]|nr:MAG: hypothetical protein ACD_58C00167G0008 [uncultured bacterium]
MSNDKKVNICRNSFLHALGIAVYVFVVVNIMQNGEKWFGQNDSIWGVFAILMLFVLSTGVCGILILGKPVIMYLDGNTSTSLGTGKKEAIRFLLATLGWLFLLVIITLIILATI